MATIREVAKAANVSITTVSKILSNDPDFRASQETRERVLKTAEELHYQYTGKKSQLHIGCIMSLTYSYSDPYFNDILGGIQSYCASHNAFISLIVSYSQLHNMTPGLKKQLSELDGLIITEIPPETLEFITTLNKKIVFVDNYIDGYCNIGYNTVYANQLIFDHIIKCGYKKIAYIGGASNSSAPSDFDSCCRMMIFRETLRANNIPYDPELIYNCDWDSKVCAAQVKELLSKHPETEVIFAGSDSLASVILSQLKKLNLKCPQDIGVVGFDEPFTKLFNQGMITGKNGIKMSKSKGNVVSPDDLVRDYGCDSLRLYELFVGPPELDAEWDDRGIEGVSRFLNRFWNLVMDNKDKDVKASKEMIKLRHKLVYDIEYRFNQFSLNTVISGFMEYNNKLIELARKEGGIDRETLKTFVILLAPFAPHIGEELWQQLGGDDSVFHAQWPECDEEAMKDDEIEVAVQINGKTRAVISISADSSKEDAIAAGREAVKEKLTGNVVKEIYVPGKIVNIVCK